MNPEQLRRREAAIIAELRFVETALMLELDAIRAALSKAMPVAGPFAETREVWVAVESVLRSSERAMTKKELVTALSAGGFNKGKTSGPYVLRDSINYHIKKGRFVESNGLVDLPERENAQKK